MPWAAGDPHNAGHPQPPPTAQVTMTVKPESQGMCSERLARIDRFLDQRYIASGRLPCAQLQISRNGQLVHQSVLGRASLETGQAMAEDTLVRIYSMTKPITSLAFMMLVEEGLVMLDDPVHKHIPAWKDMGVYVGGLPGMFQTRPCDAPMRIIDLLRHTSGLTYGFQARTNVDSAYRHLKVEPFDQKEGLDGFIEGLAKIPLEFSPGSAWNYSVATDVLGYLVGKISGMDFAEFLRTRIFEPLGMRDTSFQVRDDQVARFADCYALSPTGKLVVSTLGRDFRQPAAAPSGGGGLVSTAGDYMRFCEALRQIGQRGGKGGDTRLVSAKTLALMLSNHLPGGADLADISLSMFSEATYKGVGFGLGFAVTTDVAKTMVAGSVGEYWWGGAASTAFWIDPLEDICVVFLTQFLPSNQYPIRRELRSLVNAAVMESKL